MFQGNFFTGAIENHVFSCSHKDMEAIGMHSFTKVSCSKIWNANQNNLKVILNKDGISTLADDTTILQGGGGLGISLKNGGGVYVYYDKISETITSGTKSYSEWDTLITYHENRAKNAVGANESNDKLIRDVQTSINGGVKFTFDATTIGAPSGDIDVFLKFFKRDWDSESEQDSRVPGLASNVNIVGVASTPAGTQYSVTRTNEGIDKENIGKKMDIKEGGIRNPSNTIGAPVDYFFNSATGKWQSGNRRTIAILLSDIDPASPTQLNISEDDIKNLLPTNFTDNTLDTFTPYIPTTGLAMPVEVQQNNPNLFTPNFVKKCGETEPNKYVPETVIAVNRWRKAYKKGTHVFLTQVGPEWIIETQEQNDPVSPLKIGEWTFSKLIASSDEYFKDATWVNCVNAGILNKVTPSDYEASARRKFYNNVAPRLSAILSKFWTMSAPVSTFVDLNNSGTVPSYIANFQPSKNYIISTIFDQLKPDIGGLSNKSWIGRTNVNKGVKSDNYMEEVGIFWGPVYVEGYDSVSKKTYPANEVDPASAFYFNAATATNNTPWTSLATPKDVNGDGNYVPTKYDLPAECTSKILDPRYIFLNFNSLGAVDNSLVVPSANKPPYYESKKTSNNKVQFIPLSANLVGANDPNSAEGAFQNYERNFKARMNEYFTGYYGVGVDSSIWGKTSERYDGYGSFSRFPPGQTGTCKRQICSFKPGFPVSIANTFFPKYDCYIGRSADNPPVGYPEGVFDDIGSNQGGNCVGIICGRNTLSKRGGGNINFKVTSNFGFAPFATVSAGNFFLGILPVGTTVIPLLTSNEVRQNRGRPQYGAYQDDIYSFGTTVLAVRVFDAWPEALTTFDPRYFAVLHFNPGAIASLPTTTSGTLTLSKSDGTTVKTTYNIDQLDTPVDFRIPTDINNNIMAVNTIVNSGTDMLPRDYWRVNSIRRGMMLTNGGFKYPKLQIGALNIVVKSVTTPTAKTFGGKKYLIDQKYSLNNGLKIKITSVDAEGGISDLDIDNDDDGYPQRGDFTSSDFPKDITMPLPKDNEGKVIPGSEAAILTMTDGIVYSILMKDSAPVEQIPLTTISSSSNAGKQEVINETLTNTIGVAGNKSGKYDVFTHFHNDITHTLMYHSLYGKTSLQHITLDIS